MARAPLPPTPAGRLDTATRPGTHGTESAEEMDRPSGYGPDAVAPMSGTPFTLPVRDGTQPGEPIRTQPVDVSSASIDDAIAAIRSNPDHTGPNFVDLGSSALEEIPIQYEDDEVDRAKAIAIGLLLGAAVGLVIDAILSRFLFHG